MKPKLTFLQLIKWKKGNEERQDLRILHVLAPKWEEIGSLLGLPDADIAIIKKDNHYDVSGCIRDTLLQWLRNGSMLTNVRQYPVNWRGLYNLVVDGQLKEDADQLKEALSATSSNVKGNY